jgi:hypothetical protein
VTVVYHARALHAGEASVAAVMTFVPAELPQSPKYRGIHVNLVIRALNATSDTPKGLPLAHAPLGAVLNVLVQVNTPDALRASTVRVLLAGGLEPVDSNLDPASGPVCPLPFYLQPYRGGAGIFSIWFPPCPRVETTPANVTFYLESLAAGTHDFYFKAVAVSPGADYDMQAQMSQRRASIA